jgi:hypothetical protein
MIQPGNAPTPSPVYVVSQFSPRPSLSKARIPCSYHSSLDTQNSSRPFMMSAKTAPPRKTMCFRRGGSSMRILNFYKKNINKKKKENSVVSESYNKQEMDVHLDAMGHD